MGNGGFSIFVGVFDPGDGGIGPNFLEILRAILRDTSNAVCVSQGLHFGNLKIVDTLHFAQNRFRTRFIRKMATFFRMKWRCVDDNPFLTFLSEKWPYFFGGNGDV